MKTPARHDLFSELTELKDTSIDSTMQYVCGIDEAGRGPLAGRVYAAAVILDEACPIEGLADSKILKESQREILYAEITAKSKAFAIAYSEVVEIDELNILQATFLAMRRALDGLKVCPHIALIDGNHIPPHLSVKAEAIVKGDSKIPAISAASILAKVARDNNMLELDKLYPVYGFAKHKGYGTKDHLAAIKKYGISPAHRKTFAPIKDYCL